MEWIKTSEGLPDEDQEVLCKVGAKHIPLRIYRYSTSGWAGANNMTWHDDLSNHSVYSHFVTHWQPLPAPPKD